jgi:hypothetical protein
MNIYRGVGFTLVLFFGAITLPFLLCSCDSFNLGEKRMFRLLKPSYTGIYFNNELTETYDNNIITYQDFYSGGGVSIGDINNDNLSDVFFTGNMVPARLFLNIGSMKFLDITEQAGLSDMGKGWYTGTTMIDINNDKFLDIYVCRSGMFAPDDRENLLFVNNGDNTFSELGEEYGLNHPGYAVNATFFDYDNDQDLDMFLVNQGPEKFATEDLDKLRIESHPYCGDKLFENIGEEFIDVTEKAGIISSIIGFGHGVSAGDINKDGFEDIFVSNDFFEHDYMYLNNGDKTFREVIKSSTKHISYYSMGNDLADFNNDGWLDIIVLDMVAEDNQRLKENLGGMGKNTFRHRIEMGFHHQYMFNVLHMNNGNESFSEIGMLAGISSTDWSWGPLFADFDNDGLKDLFVSNGIRKDIRNIDWGGTYRQLMKITSGKINFKDNEWELLLTTMPSKKVTNYMYRNNGDLTFSKVMEEWGLAHPSFSNGVAYGDLDNDGDLDLVVNNIDDYAFIYENKEDQVRRNNYIRIQFSGSDQNPTGLGTQVFVYSNEGIQYQQLYLSRGYRSSTEPLLHFGLGTNQKVDSIYVIWPDKRETFLRNVEVNQLLVVNYSESGPPRNDICNERLKYFKDVTQDIDLNHKHVENEYDDFHKEALLPHKLSNLGPGLTVGDVNGDGLEDFYIGGAFRHPGHLYVQTEQGVFTNSENTCWIEDRNYEDLGAEFFDADNDGDLDLYVVSGGNEFKPGLDLLQDRIYFNDGVGRFEKNENALPEMLVSGSVVVPCDIDSDGDLDLFIGGRTVAGQYPLPANSYLLRNCGGNFADITESTAPSLHNLGMVTSALWIDHDCDNDMDLIVTGEWMPITIFQNQGGILEKIENIDNGLEHSAGWWWSLASYDFDDDGDQDLVAGNLGKNFKYKASPEEPFEIYSYDFDNNEKLDIVLGYYNEGVLYPVKGRKQSSEQIPELFEQIPSYNEFAVASLEDIYSREKLNKALNYKVRTFESCIIENLGDGKFSMVPFENYVQMSNQNVILINDVDLDGSADLIMAGNFYPVEVEATRNDAGIGFWVRRDEYGRFVSIPSIKSGLFIEGDVKDMKMIKVNGKEIILIAKNNDYMQAVEIIRDNPVTLLSLK